MKQTAVEWLFEQVWITSGEDLPELLEQAKEIEKKQQGYTEEEVLEILFELSCNSDTDKEEMKEWFEQFKKK